MKRAWLVLLLLLPPLGVAWPAWASTVAILRPRNPSPGIAETLARLQAELATVGLDVLLADRPRDAGPEGQVGRRWLDRSGSGVDAVIDILGEDSPIAIEVAIAGKHARRYEVSRVTLDPDAGNIPEKLAIRAIEILRSNLLEMDLAARKQASEPPPPILREDTPPEVADARSPRFTFEVGGSVLTGMDGVGPSLLPLIRGGWAVAPRVVVQAALSGMGSRPLLATGADQARLAQGYGVLGICFHPRQRTGWWPYLLASAGALHTKVEGQAAVPNQGHTVEQWSFLVDGGVGAGLRLSDRYFLSLEAHVHLTAPYVAVHFADAVVATSGRPNLLLTLTLGAWL